METKINIWEELKQHEFDKSLSSVVFVQESEKTAQHPQGAATKFANENCSIFVTLSVVSVLTESFFIDF